MKYIITENQRDRIFVLRRLNELKTLIRNQYPFIYPCDYDSLQTYMMAMKVEMFEVMFLDWFETVDKEIIWEVIVEIFHDEIVENYINNCKKNQN